MKFGAEPKKIAALVGLTGVAAYLLYSNLISSPASSGGATAESRVARQLPADSAVTSAAQSAAMPGRLSASRKTNREEFRPSLKHKNVDTSTIDPRLRLDLLTKVLAVEMAPAERNLFQFGAVTPAAAEPGRIIPKTQAQIQAQIQAAEQAKLNQPPPGPPPPPPITLKYYGYTAQRADGHKRAFFLDGDDIFVAAEGELIKKRYKVVRIGVNSVEVEDTQFNHTQMLPLAEEAAG